MLFKPELIEKIRTGEKTQARRLVKPGEYLDTTYESKIVVSGGKSGRFMNGRTKWIVGQTYATCPGRGKAAVGRIKLLDIRRERVQDISEGDAKADLGAPDWSGPGDPPYRRDLITCFAILWDSINTKPGQRMADNPEVWVLVFERANQ